MMARRLLPVRPTVLGHASQVPVCRLGSVSALPPGTALERGRGTITATPGWRAATSPWTPSRHARHRPRTSPSLDLAAIIGPPIDRVMQRLIAPYGDDRVTQAVAAYREHYASVGLLQSTVYPGVGGALDQLAAAGATLYVATSKPAATARRILAHLGLSGRLSGVYGAAADGSLSEKTPLIAHVLEREDLDAARCVMVGDRCNDVVGARANGVRAVGVLWGYGTREELTRAGADVLIGHPAALAAASGCAL